MCFSGLMHGGTLLFGSVFLCVYPLFLFSFSSGNERTKAKTTTKNGRNKGQTHKNTPFLAKVCFGVFFFVASAYDVQISHRFLVLGVPCGSYGWLGAPFSISHVLECSSEYESHTCNSALIKARISHVYSMLIEVRISHVWVRSSKYESHAC